MRVARLHAAGDLRVAAEAEPVPGPGESLVRVGAVGLCGSDLHWYSEGHIGDAGLTRPLVPGHEFAGVAEGGRYDGRVVAVDPAIPCRLCPMCEAGHRNLCPQVRFAGHSTTDGGLQEAIAWPERSLHPVPAEFTAADAAMLEPLGVALHAWDLAHARVGDTVAVIGAGPIGLLAIQVARAGGAGRVIVVEPLDHRRRAAERAGAATTLAPTEAGAAAWRELSGLGCDVVLEFAGTDPAIATALTAARPGARVLLGGIPGDDTSSFPAGPARRKGLTLVMVRRMKEMYPRAIDLVATGRVDVRSIVSEQAPLAAADRAFIRATNRSGLKVVIDPSA
ncbi:zinc-binding dehydrogenase [Pseudactinotalea sp. HY158]|uniref:zinc-dependent alcohol dehydrogenase n=1 Tax=Pseudactinotalea sp. HY158 TaxID=2654547 RepID=UPI00129CA7B5|nr:zinc-binding dehydrogenase [Pseudactinotalea sp. HY158]QGH69606.1 alcohol dehydrogenase catalytic domain-containing protein [Pseudactinotalea sp. HY158]